MYPLGALATVPFFSIISYAILKHELLDIKIVIKRTLVFTILTAFISAIYALVLGGIYLISQNILAYHTLLAGFISIIIITFLFQPLRDRIQHFLDRLFFRDHYDYTRALAEVSNEVSQYVNINELFKYIGHKILDVVKVRSIMLYLLNEDDGLYECIDVHHLKVSLDQVPDHPPASVDEDHAAITHFKKARTMLRNDPPDTTGLLPSLNSELAVPLFFKDDLLGFYVLGLKMSDQPFFPDDIGLLRTIANQTAVVIRNINLFQEVESFSQKLAEQDKMASLGTLAFSIAHEIKNPLTPIRAFTQKMMKKAGNSSREQDMGAKVISEFNRLDIMLSNLLNYGRTTESKMGPVDLNTIIDETLMLCSAELRRNNIQRRTEYETGLGRVKADNNQVIQLLLNLIRNAIDAMPEGGVLTIATRQENLSGKGRQAVVTVSDTGCGIEEKDQEEVFKPLFTKKPKGTGLGLAISKTIVDNHSGDIWLKSTPGKGTTFSVSFPVID